MNNHIINTLFDKVYCLYINKRELVNAQHKLNRKHINVTYFKGINGKKVLQDKYKKFSSNIHSIGAFGHIHSFIAIISDAIKNNYNNILIFESDIYFDENFDNKFTKIPEYKILYLGCSQHNWNDIMIYDNYYYANKTCGTFAVALNKTILNEYLCLLGEFKYPSDTCLFQLQEKYYGQCFVIYPNIVICNVTDSSTNRSRSQYDMIEKFKWSGIYDYWDIYICNYLKQIIIIEHFNNPKLLIIDDNYDIINIIKFNKKNFEFNINKKIYVFARNLFIKIL